MGGDVQDVDDQKGEVLEPLPGIHKVWRYVTLSYSGVYLTWAAGPPTHRAAYEKLLTAELNKSMATGEIGPGMTEFVARGLMIEREQYVVKTRRAV